MTNPFDQNPQQQYDQNGLPVASNQQWSAPQPQYGQPQYQQQYGVQQQPQYGMMQAQGPAKSWVAAILLAFFLGSLGVHNFYLGYTKQGVIQLVLTIVGWATSVILIGFIFLAIVWVWVLVDFVQLLLRSGSMASDSNGVPLS
ncbi:MAG: TM2 domain-containing protein [Corynebacterium sp.]|uniref:TM2 domain-containing protein n=1 Tax=Corynebacterium sp. TaxID=1720 RepID=UPI0026DFA95E|nr:TM2 domain-containing protein [Corynebacterium sp.]MDO5668930.1 TM2 domain-containing protein [Corynebacterium sp.]